MEKKITISIELAETLINNPGNKEVLNELRKECEDQVYHVASKEKKED